MATPAPLMSSTAYARLHVVDSHTGGEPTRVVVGGAPDCPSGSLSEQREWLRREADWLRTAVVCEPRGSDVFVGALIVPPHDPAHAAGVIFFNNVGYLGMCVHGTIGVVQTLAHLGRIARGTHVLDTPVGPVTTHWRGDQQVTVENVASYRALKDVELDVEGWGAVRGDVAWGGNWFFLVNEHRERIAWDNVQRLTNVTWRIRQALERQRISGPRGELIDHIELFGPPHDPRNHSRNFVLCPGKAFDRSPCGTGTSAKLACLAADGLLQPGEAWRQESVCGSVFEASYRWAGEQVVPQIRGRAYVTAEGMLLMDPQDPWKHGILA